MRRVTVNFDDATVEQLDLIAAQKRLPRIEVIRGIVEEHLERTLTAALHRLGVRT